MCFSPLILLTGNGPTHSKPRSGPRRSHPSNTCNTRTVERPLPPESCAIQHPNLTRSTRNRVVSGLIGRRGSSSSCFRQAAFACSSRFSACVEHRECEGLRLCLRDRDRFRNYGQVFGNRSLTVAALTRTFDPDANLPEFAKEPRVRA